MPNIPLTIVGVGSRSPFGNFSLSGVSQIIVEKNAWGQNPQVGGAPKERRRRRAEKRLSKGYFWRVRFFSAPFRFSDVLRENLKGAEKKRTLQKHPFGQPFLRTTPSPLLWRALTSASRHSMKSCHIDTFLLMCLVAPFW